MLSNVGQNKCSKQNILVYIINYNKIFKIMSSENRTSVPNSLNEHWMPFTSNKDFKANPRLITEAKGVYLKTHHGKTQIDASSGLFCNPLGHGRKEITEAVTKQLETLDYAQPFQQGFGGSFELASKIAKQSRTCINLGFSMMGL